MRFPAPPLPSDDLDEILERTSKLWAAARNTRFFITGGTGFFGIWLLESFAHANAELGLGMHATILSRDPDRFFQKCPHLAGRVDFTFLKGDVRFFSFPDLRQDFLIHAATDADAGLNSSDPVGMFSTIVDGTRHVLKYAALSGTRKLLLTSSGAVYGRQPLEIDNVSEDYLGAPDPLVPSSSYGEGKRVAEHLVAMHAVQHGYEAKIARCFAFVGPHLPLDRGFAIGNFIRDGLRGNLIEILGDGTPLRSYLYAAELTVWLWTILFLAPSGRPFNVGSDEPINIRSTAEQVARQFHPAPGIHVRGASPRSGRPERYVPATRRAREELGLKHCIPFSESINRTTNWYRRWEES